MPNFLKKRIVSKMEKNYDTNGILVIAFHELDFIVVGAYYLPRTSEKNIKTTASYNALKVLERQ